MKQVEHKIKKYSSLKSLNLPIKAGEVVVKLKMIIKTFKLITLKISKNLNNLNLRKVNLKDI